MASEKQLIGGRFQILETLGSGGMAVVYKAHDLRLRRDVALKTLRSSLTADPAFQESFREEARRVANLLHPNIVTVFDADNEGSLFYIVMEYVDAQDLKKHIRASAPFSVERTLHIGIQVCAGIGHAHRAGLVHADVKPQNILLYSNDTVKVTDFGIAQVISHTQAITRQEVVWGSPQYFSPEQAQGSQPTPASDVYMIGIVLYEMLTGKLPFSGNDQKELALAHINDPAPHVLESNPNVPTTLDWIIHKCMAKEPNARFSQADQLGRVLIDVQKALRGTTLAPASKPTGLSPSRGIPAINASQPPPREATSGPVNPYQISTPQSPVSVTPPPYSGAPSSGVIQPPIKPVEPPRYYNNPALTRPATTQPAQPQAPSTWTSAQRPVQPAYTPENHYGAPQYDYGIPPAAETLQPLTIILGCLAFIAVLGTVILWLAVWSAYS
ncbi:MAG: protein kinase [Aggregatilineales bacterium]